MAYGNRRKALGIDLEHRQVGALIPAANGGIQPLAIVETHLKTVGAIDHMVVPSGSAGTHAGIIAGMVGNNAGIPVTGIGVNRKKPVQEAAVLNLANETLEYIGAEARVPAEKVVAFDDYVGPGYSLPTDAMVEAVKMLARTEGILLDPVYSGKAMSGLIDLARKGYFPKGSNVLFLHTGGSPALYAYLPTFRA